MSDDNAASSANAPEPQLWFPWHIVFISAAYAVVVFFACALADYTFGESFPVAILFLFPLLFILGAWAAIGPLSFSIRVIAFTLIGPLVVLAGVSGLMLGDEGIFFLAEQNPPRIWTIVFLFSIPLCVAPQIPYWFLKVTFGWQLVTHESPHKEEQFSIKQMFLLTALFAIAFASPRFATEMAVATNVDQPEIGEIEYVVDPNPPPGSEPQVIEVVVTEENIESISEDRRQLSRSIASGIPIGVLLYSVVVVLLSFVFVPIVWLSLRRGSSGLALCLAASLLFLIVSVTYVLSTMLAFGGLVPWAQLFPYIFGYSLTLTLAGIIPLAISRSRGVRLVSRKSLQKQPTISQSS